jgi:hypothetical protein
MPLGLILRRSSVRDDTAAMREVLMAAEKTAAQAEGEPCCDWVGQTGECTSSFTGKKYLTSR